MVVGGRAIPSLVSHWWRRRREEKLITKTARCNSSARNFRTENAWLQIRGAAASKARTKGGISRSDPHETKVVTHPGDYLATDRSMTASGPCRAERRLASRANAQNSPLRGSKTPSNPARAEPNWTRTRTRARRDVPQSLPSGTLDTAHI